MNYPYFMVLDIGVISEFWLKRLRELALDAEYRPLEAFRRGKQLQVATIEPVDLHSFVRDDVGGVGKLADPEKVLDCTFDRMSPMHYLNEHSDAQVTPSVPVVHKIHVPLYTNPYVLFRWSLTSGNEVHGLEEGHVYLYNDVLPHSVVNGGDSHRYHLIMRYRIDGIKVPY